MAIISKLRSSGWVLGIILISLLLFILSEFFSNMSKYNSGGDQGEVGVIAGEKIKLPEYDARFKEMLTRYEQNGQVIDENSKEQVNSMVWNQYIQDKIIKKEYEKLGLTVSPDEAAVLLYSNDAHEMTKRYFSSETGFDPNNVIRFREQAKKNSSLMVQFEAIVEQIILETQTRKYNSIISKSLYATSLDAEDDYYNNTTQAKGKIVTLNYISIPDKDIKVTDAEMQDYINKHKDDFKQEEARDIEYASWNIAASKEDTLATKEDLMKDIKGFATTEDDSSFVALNNGTYDNSYKPQGSYPKEFADLIFNAPKDSVLGPIYSRGYFSLLKVTGIKDDSVSYIHAVKCEVPVKGITKQDTLDAINNAKALLGPLKASDNALEFMLAKSGDGLTTNPYDMGWFQEGTQPKEINNALKGLGNGDATVVKSIFGVSIIKVVSPKSRKLIQLAEVKRLVEPMQSTKDAVYTKASNFRSSLTDEKVDFEKMTTKAGVAKSIAKDIKEKDKMIVGIPEAGEIVRWLFNEERKEGEFSDVFTVSDRNIVIRLVKIKSEGTQSVDDARETVERLVRNEKKAEKLKADLDKVLKTAKTIEDVAIGVKSIAQPLDGLTFMSTNVPFAGSDSKIVGYIFGSKPNQLTKPFVSKDGVHVAFVESFSKPELPTTLSSRKQILYMEQKGRIYDIVFNALKKAMDVKDYRFRYY
ncbi:MAG: SurA N-terminal domain-containing protein [Bacteroidota bacterium]